MYSYQDDNTQYIDDQWNTEDPTQENMDEQGFQDKLFETGSKFDIKQIDFPKNIIKSEIIQVMAVSQNSGIFYTKSEKLFRYEFDSQNLEQLDSKSDFESRKASINLLTPGKYIFNNIMSNFVTEEKEKVHQIQRIFIDLEGQHCILCQDNGDNMYLNAQTNIVKQLPKLKGLNITAICWNDNSNVDQTKDIIIGTFDGSLYLHSLEISINKKEVSVIEGNNVNLLHLPFQNKNYIRYIFRLTIHRQSTTPMYIIIVSTDSALFHFKGSSNLEIFFQKYQQDKELVVKAGIIFPKNMKALMHVYYSMDSNNVLRPHSYLWTNGGQIFLREIPEENKLSDFFNVKSLQDFTNNSQILKYVKQTETSISQQMNKNFPIAITSSEFHYFIIHQDILTIISKITQDVITFYEFTKLGVNPIINILYEKQSDKLCLYSEKAFIELNIQNQDKDTWKLFMEKKKYKEAYEIAKKYDSENKNYIAGLYADDLLKANHGTEASFLYNDTNRNFEQICLKFLVDNNSEGVDTYLEQFMKLNSNENKMHKNILLPFLIEHKLYKLNSIENQINQRNLQGDSKNLIEQKKLFEHAQEDLYMFLSLNLSDIDEVMTYQLMVSHGRFQNCLNFAKQKGNFEEIIEHYINEQQYSEAIKHLKYVKDERINKIIYKYNHIFMRHEPELIIQFLKQNKTQNFDPTKLITGLMDVPLLKRDVAIDFIQYCIKEFQINDKAFYNVLIFFLSEQNLDDLYQFLDEQEYYLKQNETLYFDLDFALRLFQRKNIIRAEISIYGMMGFYTEAVNLAINNNMLDLAKSYANKPSDNENKKKLWLQVVQYMFKQDYEMSKIINLTKETSLLKIEDILPFFNENTTIEHFKEQICESLEQYNKNIIELKEEMKGYSENSEQLKIELRNIKNQYLVIPNNQKCEDCCKSIFQEEFIIFPCMHSFHNECLLNKIKQNPYEKKKLPMILELKQQIDQFISKKDPKSKQQNDSNNSYFFNFLNMKKEEKSQLTLSEKDQKELQQLKERYDLKLASECLYCGRGIVESIYLPFDNYDDKMSWDL